MKNSSKIVLLIFAGLLVLSLAYFVADWRKNNPAGQTPAENENQKENLSEEPKNEDQQKTGKFQEAIAHMVQNIATLSPEDPVLGGSWFVTRFWFADENNFYAEYEDGHILRQILLRRDGEKYEVVGYFEPGENAFELKQGKDALFGRDLVLYEKNQTTGEWERKN